MVRQVVSDRHQVGVGAGGVRRLQPLVELVDVQPPLARGHPQDLGDLVPVLVGDAQLRRVVALELSRHTAQRIDAGALVAAMAATEQTEGPAAGTPPLPSSRQVVRVPVALHVHPVGLRNGVRVLVVTPDRLHRLALGRVGRDSRVRLLRRLGTLEGDVLAGGASLSSAGGA